MKSCLNKQSGFQMEMNRPSQRINDYIHNIKSTKNNSDRNSNKKYSFSIDSEFPQIQNKENLNNNIKQIPRPKKHEKIEIFSRNIPCTNNNSNSRASLPPLSMKNSNAKKFSFLNPSLLPSSKPSSKPKKNVPGNLSTRNRSLSIKRESDNKRPFLVSRNNSKKEEDKSFIRIQSSGKSNSNNANKRHSVFNLPRNSLKKTDNMNNYIASSYSHCGKTEFGKEKTNQDSLICDEKLPENHLFSIFGVMDGHGENGHLVSQYIKGRVSKYFFKTVCSQKKFVITTVKKNQQIKSSSKVRLMNVTQVNELDIRMKLKSRNFFFIKDFYKRITTELKEQKEFDCNNSGSTCLILFLIGDKLIVSNTGDSRLILIKEHFSSNSLYTEQVSIDHKPNEKKEKERIHKLGGEISQCMDENGVIFGPFRIWEVGKNTPGLAISRSVGDFSSEKLGIISDPDIFEKDIDQNTKAIVLGSDGLYDYLSNDEISAVVMKFYYENDPEQASKELYKVASLKWESNCLNRDDISIIVIFIHL